MANIDMCSVYKLGDRIVLEDSIGTIKFIGELNSTKGSWLGIDWDDASRGKHNGSYKGQEYFKASHPKSGSFIKPEKVSIGKSFTTAVIDRYGEQGETAGVNENDMFVLGHNQKTTVEVVGAKSVNKQQSEFKSLRSVVLRGEYVNNADSGDAIAQLTPKVTELDISRSLLRNWTQVAAITQQLKYLKQLNVSDNQLILENNNGLCEAFQRVKIMFMNRMSYNWNEILQCATLWPLIEELHLCFNTISVLDCSTTCFQSLTLLNLEGNKINDWHEILKIGNIHRLSTLILNDTGLDSIIFPDVQLNEKSHFFKSLQSLSVANNDIKEMRCLHELDKLHSLEDLNLRGNPLAKEDTESVTDIRTFVFACIGNLKSLNRTKLDREERKHCEWEYIKVNGLKWKKAGGNQDPDKNNPSLEFCESHPRYNHLISMYGAPEDSELQQYTSALKSTLISITMTCPSKPGSKMMTKKMPGTMTVQKLKMLLHKIYKIEVVNMKLTYTSPETEDVEYELEADQKELNYYAMAHGDTIIVSEH